MKPCLITDAREFGKVGVVMGGRAAEREISLLSGKAVLAALQHNAIDAVGIDIGASVVAALQQESIDRVFNIVHGRGGEDGVLQGVLEGLQVPYTGSGVMASALSMDKLRTKMCWRGAGLLTPAWFRLAGEEAIDLCIKRLPFPMIIKPALEGSSLGMSRAGNRQELVVAWELARQYQCDVYAEAWVVGEEYTVAVLHGEALPVIRLETPHVFYDYDAKYSSDTTRYHCPCGLPADLEQRLQQLALSACEVLGVSGWARVDVFIDVSGNAQLIEVNTVPGMTDHSLVPMAAQAAGLDFKELTWRILETSL